MTEVQAPDATTRDVGNAVADFVSLGIGQGISAFIERRVGDPGSLDSQIVLDELPNQFTIRAVDKSDPNNPLLELDNGQRFRLHVYPEPDSFA